MATVAQWIEGARPRTLPNSISPVLVGAGAARAIGQFVWWQAVMALIVALALQVGVNYANDYSDGIRGTDANRVGPFRLVGSGSARPKSVLVAALACLGIAAVAGLALVAATGHWWLLVVGAACIAAAWYYTGGKRPYGYSGLGEVAVFVFFGLIGVLGTLYVQSAQVTLVGVGGAIGVGVFSSAVLVANNLRDIPTDRDTGKHTLAVRLGDRNTRTFYCVLVAVPFVVTVLAAVANPWLLVGFLALIPMVGSVRTVVGGATGRALIPVLRDTAMGMLIWSATTAVALALA